jgi:hypothetical protein
VLTNLITQLHESTALERLKLNTERLNLRLVIAVLMTLLVVAAFTYAYFDYQTVTNSCSTIASLNDVNACSQSQKYFLGAVVGGVFATIITLVLWAMYRADSS